MGTSETAALAETPDLLGAYPRLSDVQIAALARHGERRRTERDEVLYREGEANHDFLVILAGKVAVVEEYGRRERVIAVHGPGRFLGELSLLIGRVAFLTAVVREAGEVLAVPVHALAEVISRDSALGDLVLRALIIRRSLLIGLGTGLRIIGSRFSPGTRRLLEFAARNRLPHRWIDLEDDEEAEALLRELGVAPEETPVVVWRGTQVLRNPSTEELARVIGLRPPTSADQVFDLVVVGAGPAGLAAAVYAASDGLTTVVLDAVATGGQASTAPRIENYPGFPAGISGAELADRAAIQAEKFGARVGVPTEATTLGRREHDHLIGLHDGTEVVGRTVLISTGVRYRKLPVPGLERFEGTSVFYAATEIEARLCGQQPVAVVGSGNSAGQATVFLAERAAKVYLLVRGGRLEQTMSRYLVDRIERAPNVEVLPGTEVRELVGEDRLTALVLEDTRTGRRDMVEARALFVFVGAQPRTGWLAGQLAIDERGFVLTGFAALPPETRQDVTGEPFLLETSRAGVFAAGDVRSGSIKRVASAVGEGAMVVAFVHQHLGGGRIRAQQHRHETWGQG